VVPGVVGGARTPDERERRETAAHPPRALRCYANERKRDHEDGTVAAAPRGARSGSPQRTTATTTTMPRDDRHASRRNNRTVEPQRLTSSRTLVVAPSPRYCHCRHRQRAIDHEDGDPRAAGRVARRREHADDRSRVIERDGEGKRGSLVYGKSNRCRIDAETHSARTMTTNTGER